MIDVEIFVNLKKIDNATFKQAINLCCAARGHALAVFQLLAQSAIAHALAPLG